MWREVRGKKRFIDKRYKNRKQKEERKNIKNKTEMDDVNLRHFHEGRAKGVRSYSGISGRFRVHRRL